jgi:nucleotide-binding universal stress UspA family protein
MNKMKTIIAPTDFSSTSLNAVRYAADLAVSVNASLLLVNIVPLPVMAEGYASEMLLAEMENDARAELKKLKKELASRTNEKIDITYISDIGTVEYSLEDICTQESPFVVVMSTKHSTELERFFEGSNTLSAVRHIPYPILVIPPDSSFRKIRKIAVAFDLEHAVNEHSIAIIKEWVSFFKASVDIVNVCRRADISPQNLLVSEGIQKQLTECTHAFHFIIREKVEDGINDYIKKSTPDMLIVLPKNRGTFGNLFHKSHSIPLLLHPTTIPILAIAE